MSNIDPTEISKNAIEGLKSQPAFFALLAVAGAVFFMSYMAVQENQKRELQRFNAILERCNFQQYGGPRP